MTKHDILTDSEFMAYKPPARAVAQLKQYIQSNGFDAKDVKVLDWGCGRGRFVLWLRENGYHAFGVDIDPEPIENGLVLFNQKGYIDQPLTLISNEGKTVYDDGYFDFVMTDNVLEHVSSIDTVISEIDRITAPKGAGYHIFPAHRQPVEGHLFMPFVHWIKPGKFRRFMISFFVKMGREPKWKELDHSRQMEKVETYYKYSLNNIFYRHFSVIQQKFEKKGFEIQFLTIDHPEITKNKLLGPMSKSKIFRGGLSRLLLTFKQVEIFANRKKIQENNYR